MMMKIINIVGARPQFIKYFPVSRAIASANKNVSNGIKDVLVHTGQHYDYAMSKVFFDEFGIGEPDYHLNVGSGTHGIQTGQIVQRVEEVLQKESSDAVIVYGDTNSTLGGALAATKMHIPVAHVEAGLRSFNRYMPEEINRILTDHVSSLLLCPSRTAVNNLGKEGFNNILNDGELISRDGMKMNIDVNNPVVINVGDVMFDVVLHAVEIADRKSNIIEKLGLKGKDYCLLTLHRAENTDCKKAFENIVDFLNDTIGNRECIFPMHPRAKRIYYDIDRKLRSNVSIIEPLGYFDLLKALKNSSIVFTDSGGLQKEAYWMKVPCVTLRIETEWIETVKSGWNVLYKNYTGSHVLSGRESCYGDGKTAERIIDIFTTW